MSNASCALEFGVILEDFCAIELPITGMLSVCLHIVLPMDIDLAVSDLMIFVVLLFSSQQAQKHCL